MSCPVYARALAGSNLYAGGDFTMAGGIAVNGIARWDGTNWSALGSGMDADVLALALSGSGLYAGGKFTTAGGSTGNGIAKGDGGRWAGLGSGVGGLLARGGPAVA